MASLFERLAGLNLNEGDDKIAIHSFCGALYEYGTSNLTGQQVAQIYALDASQVTQALALVDIIQAAPNKALFMRVFKNCLYMAESGDYYLTLAALVTRLQAEVVDQGGTLP